ncbi:hypothetical protein PACTADRAFT_50792 [Pachysolen tannophilus NRRL Y-2460]|uniref:Conserved oligomeric Golgi complex subunit 4 n=1 Tax=Pachysolen tannophilus NRRL Y-2460 TaxID=669874 RepID=A0A1E4TT48_PACTA|nr:hypothetical protein PACTADRAFT_50792 [Pachysolen tannophilus NRRL Y-2460]
MSMDDGFSEQLLNDNLKNYHAQLNGSNSISKLNKLVNQIDLELDDLNNYINDKYLLNKRILIQKSINSLEMNRVNLSLNSLSFSNKLSDKFNNANDLSYKLTRKVKLLDKEKEKVNRTLNYLSNVIFLKKQIMEADSFIESKNWLEASTRIHNILTTLPQSLLNDKYVSFIVPTQDLPELPSITVSKWVEELTVFFKEEFEKAADLKDVSKLTYYFQLFPLLLQNDIGLNCYSKFICKLINEQSKNLLMNLSKELKLKPGFYSLTLLKIFEIISSIINQHSNIIIRYYGLNSMCDIMTKIQKECDLQCGLIFDTFWDLKNINNVLNDIKNYDFPILINYILQNSSGYLDNSNEDNDDGNSKAIYIDSKISIVEVNELCSELSSILKNWKMYCNFFRIKWNEYKNLKNSNIIPEPVEESSFLVKINTKIQPIYDKLSTFYLRRSIEKSCELELIPDLSSYLTVKSDNDDSYSPESPPISSVIEDIIIVLNNMLGKTIETGNESIIKNMITNSRRILENDLLNVIANKLRTIQPRTNVELVIPVIKPIPSTINSSARNSGEFNREQSLSPRSGTPNPSNYGSFFMRNATNALNSAINFNKDEDLKNLEHFLIFLNSVDSLKTYLDRIIENLKLKLKNDKLFLYYDDNNTVKDIYENSLTKKLSNIIENFNNIIDAKIENILNENIKVLYNQVFNTKLIKLTNDFFKILEIENDNNNEVLIRFLKNFRSLILPYWKVLSNSIFMNLMNLLTINLSKLFEKKFLNPTYPINNNKNLTYLNILNLEKNFSVIINDISKINYKLRNNFIKLTQIIMVLSLDDDEESELFLNDEEVNDGSNNKVVGTAGRNKVGIPNGSNTGGNNGNESDEEDDDDSLEIKWVLTPAERRKVRSLRIDRK